MDKELRERLYWLNEELTEQERALLLEDEEPEFIQPPRRQRRSCAEKQELRTLEKIDPLEERSVPVIRKKGIKGLIFLAMLEIIGILLVIGWWMQWLI